MIAMKRNWYFIVGAPTKLWALYDDEKEVGDQFTFYASLIGYIERNRDGSWACFYGIKFMGNEPNKKYAMALVASESKP